MTYYNKESSLNLGDQVHIEAQKTISHPHNKACDWLVVLGHHLHLHMLQKKKQFKKDNIAKVQYYILIKKYLTTKRKVRVTYE